MEVGRDLGAAARRSLTGVRPLQLVPPEEGPLLLLAQVGALLQEPVGDPTLADAWRVEKGARSAVSLWVPVSLCGANGRLRPVLTCNLSDHGLGDPPVGQE